MAQKGQSYFDPMRHGIAIGIPQQLFHSIHKGIVIQDAVQPVEMGYVIIGYAELPDKITGQIRTPALLCRSFLL